MTRRQFNGELLDIAAASQLLGCSEKLFGLASLVGSCHFGSFLAASYFDGLNSKTSLNTYPAVRWRKRKRI